MPNAAVSNVLFREVSDILELQFVNLLFWSDEMIVLAPGKQEPVLNIWYTCSKDGPFFQCSWGVLPFLTGVTCFPLTVLNSPLKGGQN